MKWTLAILLALTAVASAQHWEFEQVDTAGSWGYLQLRQGPTGTLYCCYVDQATDSVVLATRDSVWHREYVTQSTRVSFDVGRGGHIGLLCDDSYIFRTDTGWTTIPVPFSNALLAIDPSGTPGCARWMRDRFYEYLVLHEWSDTLWTSDTARRYWELNNDVHLADLAYDSDGLPRILFRLKSYTYDRSPFWCADHVLLLTRASGTWTALICVGGELGVQTRAYDVAARPTSGVSYAWWTSDGRRFGCDTMVVDTGPNPGVCQVCVDSSDVRHLAYNAAGGRALYATNPDSWRHETILDSSVLAMGGIALDGEQPVVALITADSTIRLARRCATGVLEQQIATRMRGNFATVARGDLLLPERPGRQSLFSLTGRHVTDLHAGENDIRCLSPGIYFIREESARATRKVVVTR